MKQMFFFLFLFTVHMFQAQEKPLEVVDIPAANYGGKEEFQRLFNNQLLYPKEAAKKRVSETITISFTVSKEGIVSDPFFKTAGNPYLQTEAKRLLRYYRFDPAMLHGKAVSSIRDLTFSFELSRYGKICRQRGFSVPKYSAPVDTSLIIYDRADQSPEYYKGAEALQEFILTNLDYPALAKLQNVQGTVVLSFVVETTGMASNIKIVKGLGSTGCDEEALRVLRLIKWKPAIKDGKLVRYEMKYPIVFNLSNTVKDNSMSEQR